MAEFVTIEFPSNLGLRPTGVEQLPEALQRAGLHERIESRRTERVEISETYQAARPPDTGVLNAAALKSALCRLGDQVASVARAGSVPLVLAGDCSVILGGLLGLRQARRLQLRSERVGLLFIDGHVDFYQPDASPTGEAADMDLALATGRGPEVLTQMDGTTSLVRDEDVIAIGARDADERDRAGAQDIRATAVHLFELEAIRARGIEAVAAAAVTLLRRPWLDGFWLHLDADVLDDEIMPAVDYRQPGGLSPAELTTLLRMAMNTGDLAGTSVSIYNPALDPDGRAGRMLVECIAGGFRSSGSV